LKNGIHIQKKGLPGSFLSRLVQLATFGNPEFYKAQAKRFSTHRIPRYMDCSMINEDTLILPRGCLDDIKKIANESGISISYADKRNTGHPLNVSFQGKLTSAQEEAVTALQSHDHGVLQADTGFGKTVAAASLIARNKINTLILVHRTQLIDQWKERLSTFLNIPIKEIGQIGGGKNKATFNIDIATIQSLNHKGQIKSEITQYGQIIVDECHHISALSFEKVLKAVRAQKIFGLTATPTRKDGLHPIIFMQCGPIRYKTNAKKQAKIRPFNQILITRNTNVKTKEEDIQNIYAALACDQQRNDLIFNDVLLALEEKRSPVILTERIDHITELEKRFKGFAKNIIVLSGALKKKGRKEALQKLLQIPDNEERLIIATGKYIGEGFDDARLDTLFLTMPVSWKGTLQQYVGRLHRNHDNKREVQVYDYVDQHVPILMKMFEKRAAGYKALGYKRREGERKAIQNEQMELF
jgi:superfamily II DNA or RNA helicase